MINILECDCLLIPTITIIKTVYNILKIVIPIAFVVLGMIDFVKAIASSDDSAMKKVQSSFFKKIIAAVFVFFAFVLVDFSMEVIAEATNVSGTGSWLECWSGDYDADDINSCMEQAGDMDHGGGGHDF